MIEWKVEEIKAPIFDDNGKETGIWEGYAVRKISHPSRHCFECRDKTNADMLCDFLNKNFSDDLYNWKLLLNQLEADEKALAKIDDEYKKQEMDILQNTDFEKLYNGKNNEKIRKAHVKKELKHMAEDKKNLELKIEHTKKEISYLKAATYRKTELMRLR